MPARRCCSSWVVPAAVCGLRAQCVGTQCGVASGGWRGCLSASHCYADLRDGSTGRKPCCCRGRRRRDLTCLVRRRLAIWTTRAVRCGDGPLLLLRPEHRMAGRGCRCRGRYVVVATEHGHVVQLLLCRSKNANKPRATIWSTSRSSSSLEQSELKQKTTTTTTHTHTKKKKKRGRKETSFVWLQR